MYNASLKLTPLSLLIIVLTIGALIVMNGTANLSTEILGGAIGGLVVLFIGVTIPWLRGRYWLFELRFLDSHENPHPKGERRSTVVSLPVGRSVLRFSLRPRTDISSIARIQFTAFDNTNYLQRWIPGITGRFIATSEIAVEKLKRRNDDGTWSEYETLNRDETSSYVDIKLPFYEGSRQVFEVTYRVNDSTQMHRWDGILGFQIQFQQSGNNRTRNVNSKAFTKRRGHRPVTFALRQVQEADLTKP